VGYHGINSYPRYCIDLFLNHKAFVHGLDWNPQVPSSLEQDKTPLLPLPTLRSAEAGEKPIMMNSLAVHAGVAATTITRLARTDDKAASALSLDLASKIVTVLDCGIED
jgi:hypothetical protein